MEKCLARWFFLSPDRLSRTSAVGRCQVTTTMDFNEMVAVARAKCSEVLNGQVYNPFADHRICSTISPQFIEAEKKWKRMLAKPVGHTTA
ncbi:hypothetical protein VTO42DRAFT_6326 [Malbranchea cinnamomea]